MKNIRSTSISAFKKLIDEGLLSGKRAIVYEILFKHGPLTGMELRRKMPKGFVDSQVRARLNEMREMGLAKEIGKKTCRITKMNVILWDVTKRKNPKKIIAKKKTRCKYCEQRGYE